MQSQVPLASPGDFYIVHLPDTQFYWRWGPAFWPNMTWNISHWQPRPAYVTQVGDFTQGAQPTEFAYGRWCMSLLGGIPWGVSIGNHDYDSVAWPPTSWSRWTAAGMGPLNFVNVVQTPQGPMAVLHLEYMPSDSAIEVAFDFLDENPTMPAMLTIHQWLDSDGVRTNTRTDRQGDLHNDAEAVWQKLVQTYPQIVLVVSGHSHDVERRRDTTMLGRDVEQHLFDVSADPNGGNGFERLYAYVGDRLFVATLSVLYSGTGPNRTEFYSVPYDLPAVRAELTSKQVTRHYPTKDTFVMPCWGGGAVHGNREWLWAAGSGCHEHGLVQFDVSSVRSVSKAILTVTCEGYSTDGDGFTLHRMRRSWTEGDSWQSLGGLTAGIDYRVSPDATVGPHGLVTLNIEVTDMARAWLTEPNHGILVKGLGETSGFRTREWRAKPERPRLTIVE